MVGLNGKKAFGDVPVLPVSGTVQDDHRRLCHRICPIFIYLMNNYRLSIFLLTAFVSEQFIVFLGSVIAFDWYDFIGIGFIEFLNVVAVILTTKIFSTASF
ncbi:hypothetical protein [uncultured Bilophila sp.]|uniref:hypothetical protein n=1 Tax=uncultured Bilophila sp. TaxID=529385 RepID=UPI00266F17E9|nr:hypothetical protein [uncultured Bilophila sp.]